MTLDTRLLKTIAFLYEWQDDEIADLERELLDRRIAIWRDVIRVRAHEHGCAKAPNPPAREHLAELRRMCDEDARSIANTWKQRVERELLRLYRANPKGNRNYYFKNLEAWASRNRAYHNHLIGNYTLRSTEMYASDQFRKMNGLRGTKYVYAGPSPVGPECVKRRGHGIADEAYVQTHRTPAHPNCPHRWVVINPVQIPCDKMWT